MEKQALDPPNMCVNHIITIESIERAIDQSSFIMDLEYDWDGQASYPDGEGSLPVEPATWERSGDFLREIASDVMRETGIVIDAPEITPAADGSIDINWRTPSFSLLVNVSDRGPRIFYDFYGEALGEEPIKGILGKKACHRELVSWLSRRNWSTP